MSKKEAFSKHEHDLAVMGGEKTKDFFLKLVKTRKTTYEFSKRNVQESNLKRILEAGRWAPSCSNSQPWHFIIVKNKRTIKQLMMTANYGDFFHDPPLIIALMLSKEKCPGKKFSCFVGNDIMTQDALLCLGALAAHITLEARELGIDSCIVTPHQKGAKKILKMKEKDVVPILVGLGYQSKHAFQKKRERNSIESITSYEYFGGRR